MLEVAGEEIQTLTMDHHGLVAAVCKDLKIAEKIDKRLGTDKQRVVSPGKSVVAMILNGLGFTNRRLYLTNQFFATKPVERLLDTDIKAADLTDYTLGHTLDEIWEYGASRLFGDVAFETALENNLLGRMNHLDTTSISVEGEYKAGIMAITEKSSAGSEAGNAVGIIDTESAEPKVINITHGYSKDHKPYLKQVVLSLVVNGPSSIPIWMEPLDGNSSDKVSFHETIKKVQDFQKQIDLENKFKWVVDSALYTKDRLLKNNNYTWLTRVPETIKEASKLLEKPDQEIKWLEQEKGYKIAPFMSNYGETEQRWLLVFSEQAYKREKYTLEKNLIKKEVALKKALWHLNKEIFESKKEGKKALAKLIKKYPLFSITVETVVILKHNKKGKPKVEAKKRIVGYKINATFTRNIEAIEHLQNKKGRFILATNDLDVINYPDEYMLTEYKQQQDVEGGFRFIKDPWFMVDSVFLKSAKRIEALMMVMTLCLMVYNVAQFKLRETLKTTDSTVPNQLGKPVKNPTLRWVFQIFEGISIVRFYKNLITDPIKELITNLNNLRKKIIVYFGKTACEMYGLNFC